jgi:hypothetical protein
MMPIRYRRAQLARQLKEFHAGHDEFIRERLRAFDDHNGRDKMIPVTHRKLKPSPYTHHIATFPRDRAPMSSA